MKSALRVETVSMPSNRHYRQIGLFLLLLGLVALGAKQFADRPTEQTEQPAKLRTVPPDLRSGETVTVKAVTQGCYHHDEFESKWTREGDSYKSKGQEKSATEMSKLRAVILATRLSPDPLTEFDSLPEPERITRRIQELFPWVDSKPPIFQDAQTQAWMRQVIAHPIASTSSYSVRLELGGEPALSLTMAMGDIGGGYLSGFPEWTVKAGNLTWVTHSPKMNEALAQWVPGNRGLVKSLAEWSKRAEEAYAEVEGSAWAESYIRSEYKDWPGSDLIPGDFLKKIDCDLDGTSLLVQIQARPHVDEIRLYFGSEGPRKEWTWVARERLLAEKTLAGHAWFESLARTAKSITLSKFEPWDSPWKAAGLPGAPRFELTVVTPQDHLFIQFRDSETPALILHAHGDDYAAKLNGGAAVPARHNLLVTPEGRATPVPGSG